MPIPKVIELQDHIERTLPTTHGFVFITMDKTGEITLRRRSFHPDGDDAFRAMAALLVRHPRGAEIIEAMAAEAGS